MRRRLREGGFFKLRVLIGVLLCFAAITVVLFALGKASAQPRTPLASPPKANKIAPWVMEHTANGQEAEFFVMLADQADLSGADSLPAKVEKGRFVYETLLSKAQTTQEPILQLLRDSGIEHQSFYIVNAILVKGTREVAEMLAARADVASVDGNPTIHNDLPQPGPVEMSSGPRTPATIEPGIVYTHAPLVWALGYIGQNIVIASADTGVRWTHNALKPHYRGWDGVNANHNLNWHDSIHDSVGNPCGNDTQAPCDDFFHGSHTTGTAIGDDGMGNQIGMAPGAKWIGCRNMDVGNGTPARYIECMQWFLAPYPLNCTPAQGDPTKAPDITINSWGCPASEGCTTGDELRVAVEAQAAAGIQMVVAAGNSGPGCSTVSDPPSFYAASYTAGALTTGTDTIAGFSSRGPVTRDGSNRTKPDITAPGTSTRSACNSSDTCYTFASGTSMATPHIAGAMGLLWCARPSLRHLIQASRDALDNAAFFISSTFCGTAGPPNNVYGWGRVDISAAVGMPSPTATPSPTPSPTASPVACLQGSATPTPTVTATPTATRTPTATPIVTATPTATRTPTPTPTVVATATPTATCAASYTTTTGTGTITAGGTDIGNHCDDCDTLVNLPFPVSVYGTPISVAYAGSNGTLQFVAVPQPKPFYFMQCIPVNPTQGGPFLNTLFPYYDDQRTDVNPLQTCADCGIFTQTLGTAPNRQFVIRWKTTYFNFAGTAEYEVLLTEGSNTLSVIYGATANNGLTAASGIQQNLTQFTSFSCMTATLTSGLRVNYIPTSCGASPTPTPTPTATRTPTPTATPTPTSTPQQRATPTARPQLTPAPRP